ncbi:resuscitation-promoting factor [Glutamicibacter sp. MNS18]|uniref:resuscitation-promoting factor n=1 Tax=Glutamicibacter sp. MNS18 TaxID=2989817 RepID=UPI00278C87F3|nr:resuscitation-promoting factor [Glutamicibacter sp. MNS18]
MHLLKKRSVKFLAQAVAVAVIIAGAVFYIAGQKSVTIAVDGNGEVVTTRAATVGDLLAQQEITLDERDEISLALDVELSDDQVIDIKRNKSIEVSVDGTDRVVHTTGMTVADVVQQLDLENGAEISVADDIELAALSESIEIVTPKTVNLKVGTEDKKQVKTTALTVADVLAAEDITLGSDDELNVKVDGELTKDVKDNFEVSNKMNLDVIRVEIKTWDENRAISFETKEVKDAKLDKGKTKVETKGKKGERELTLRQETRNGEKGEEEVLKSKVTTEPVAQVVKVGTKKVESTTTNNNSGNNNSNKTKSTSTPKNISSTWAALAKCESGGNWSINTGNGYYGGLQFSASSWRAVGGTQYAPLPHQATPQQQIAAAEKLRANGGWGHWPSCSRKLGLR